MATSSSNIAKSSNNPKFSDYDSDSDSVEEPNDKPFILEPVTIAGHTWCHINNIQYHVWVKNSDAKININDDEKYVGISD